MAGVASCMSSANASVWYSPSGKGRSDHRVHGTRTLLASMHVTRTSGQDSTASLLYCQTGPSSISYMCNSDTTVVTMASNPAKHYTMGTTAPGAFNQAASSSDDDGYTQFESKFTRNSLGLADSVTLGPLTMKYVYRYDDQPVVPEIVSRGSPWESDERADGVPVHLARVELSAEPGGGVRQSGSRVRGQLELSELHSVARLQSRLALGRSGLARSL